MAGTGENREQPRERAARFNWSLRIPGEPRTLDEAKLSYQETTAEEYQLPNKPGALAQYLEKLATKGVNLNSIYATAAKGGKKAVVVYAAEAKAKAEIAA
jgi:hypothetical protein